ncbi:hypothetical protein BH11PLA2_BH11PLA2_08590 [soil metagenome]
MIRIATLLLCSSMAFAAAPAPKDAGTEPASLKVRKALDDTGDVVLENQSMNEFVNFFKNRMKVDVKADATAMINLNGDATTPMISVNSRGKTYRAALKAALEPHQLHFAVVGGTLVIGSEEGVLQKQLRQTVSIDSNGTSVASLLKSLADDTGANIVLDPRQAAAADAGKVTLKLDDVPLETAVRLSVEVGGLRVVRLNNVLFVTNDARADKLRTDADGPVTAGPNMGGLFGGGLERAIIGGAAVPNVAPAAPIPIAPPAPAPPAPSSEK